MTQQVFHRHAAWTRQGMNDRIDAIDQRTVTIITRARALIEESKRSIEAGIEGARPPSSGGSPLAIDKSEI
jgi:hypothetical protein